MGRMNRIPHKPLSVLLASAAYAGTLAAVRTLGRQGFRISVMSSPRLGVRWSPRISAAAWSRYARRIYRAPPEGENQRFLDQLLRIGAADPGQILLATSDETAWLYTVNAALLQRHFCMYQPPVATMQKILDKRRFANAASAAGVPVVPVWEAPGPAQLSGLAANLPYPILIKPRTHVNRLRNDKGVLVRSPAELLEQYPRVVAREQWASPSNPVIPEALGPILQQFVRVGREGVCSVTGFIDRTGELFVTRRSKKILQRSQPAGVGVCFESLPPDSGMSDAVRRLCRELGYFGIFEVEFLLCNGVWAVIDFNPRTFNQIGMDIGRGMPLPLLACLDAAGEAAALRLAVAGAQEQAGAAPTVVFCDRFTLRALLLARRLTARISREELAYWRSWLQVNSAHCVDVAAADGDPLPRLIHIISEIFMGVRAVRRFLRLTPRTARTVSQPSESA
jgi:predicted ATP-grasp superfamily ATP-dependent carboligase